MAVLATESWIGSNGAAWPAQWSPVTGQGGSATIQSSAGRLTNPNNGTFARYQLTGLSASDVDVTFTINVTAAGSSQTMAVINLRDAGGSATDHGAGGHAFTNNGYFFQIITHSTRTELYLFRSNNGAGTWITENASAAVIQGATWSMRLRLVGGHFQFRMWQGSTEPTLWDLDATDSTPYLTAGTVSLAVAHDYSTTNTDASTRIATFDSLTVSDFSVTPGVTFINSATVANSGGTDASITVPTGVTTAHLGILTVATQNQGMAAMTVPSGWTARTNPAAGSQTGTLYIFTRLGGVSAGQTITATLPSTAGAQTTAAWYDTGGRDISVAGSAYNTASSDVTTVTFPATGHTGAADVLLVMATRTTNANTLPAPGTTVKDYEFQNSSNSGGAYFGHANDVISQVYTATWSPAGATSHNVAAMQLAIAPPLQAFTGSDALSGSGTLTLPSSLASLSGSAALAGSGSLAAFQGGSLAPSGSGTTTFTGTSRQLYLFDGVGTLTLAGRVNLVSYWNGTAWVPASVQSWTGAFWKKSGVVIY